MGGADGSQQRMPEPGDVLLGRFRIESVIGEGGMGLVLGARILPYETPVAIKVLSPKASISADGIRRFVNEAHATTKLTSQHVVKVFEAGTLDIGLPFIVMERLEGTDLGGLVAQQGPLPITEAVDFVIQAADAVAEAHVHGIVHRDLKPSNLFLVERPGSPSIVKVLDFGVSKIANIGSHSHVQTAPGAILGSPHYMSPEQLKSARDVDARADIWSFGIILHELLTGQLPFGGKAFPEIFMNVLRTERPPLASLRANVPEGLDEAVDRCLRRAPEERFGDVGELARALAPYASREGARAAERVGRPPPARAPIPAPGSMPESAPALAAPGVRSTAQMPAAPPLPPSDSAFAMQPPPPLAPRPPGSSSGELTRLPPSSPALPSFHAAGNSAGQVPQPRGSERDLWGEEPPSQEPSQLVVAVGVAALVFGLVGLVLIILSLHARARAQDFDPTPPAISSPR